MGDPAEVRVRRSRQALAAARSCPRCDAWNLPHRLCDDHRCTARYLDGTSCKNSRTYPELGVCGFHVRERPETEEEKLLKYLAEADPDTMTTRILRRRVLIPDNLSASEMLQAGMTINTDEFLAKVMRGDGDKGAQMREAGFTALADALGL